MVGIETDMAMLSEEARLLDPVGDHPHLLFAVAIVALDPRMNALIETDHRAGGDDVVEAEPPGDRVGVEPVGGGRQHQPPVLRAVARDRQEGRRLVLATASYRLYAEAIAGRLGFDDVIATGSVIGLDDRVHAKIDGDNCYGPAKLRMIAEWVERSGLTGVHGHVRFYSDHASDEPVFDWSDEPVAVNPHARLARLAATRGWAVEDWG